MTIPADPAPRAASHPMSGRRAEAARNDARIVEAARAVFLADPGAPVAAVAKRAGVGVASLYRRYPSKDALLQRLFFDSSYRALANAQAALADPGNDWEVFCRYMRQGLDDGDGALSLTIPVTFPMTEEIRRLNAALGETLTRLLDRMRAAGVVRPDIEIGDLGWIYVPLQAIESGDPVQTAAQRQRQLAILLDGMRPTAPAPLPGAPPGWTEFGEMWEQVIPSRRAADVGHRGDRR